ncbi:hypothetical protein BDW71DRAFT_178408 [Aspergillus fruticulosus]
MQRGIFHLFYPPHSAVFAFCLLYDCFVPFSLQIGRTSTQSLCQAQATPLVVESTTSNGLRTRATAWFLFASRT